MEACIFTTSPFPTNRPGTTISVFLAGVAACPVAGQGKSASKKWLDFQWVRRIHVGFMVQRISGIRHRYPIGKRGRIYFPPIDKCVPFFIFFSNEAAWRLWIHRASFRAAPGCNDREHWLVNTYRGEQALRPGGCPAKATTIKMYM